MTERNGKGRVVVVFDDMWFAPRVFFSFDSDRKEERTKWWSVK